MLLNDHTVKGPMPGLHHYCRTHIAARLQSSGTQHNIKNILWIAKETQNFRQGDFGDGQFGPRILCNRVKVLLEGTKKTQKTII